MRRLFGRLGRRDDRPTGVTRCDDCDACAEPCALSRLPAGIRATVVKMLCPHADAARLRILGVFEGSAVTIVDDRVGVVLDVRGTRVAIGASLAAAIIGVPLV